MKSRMRLRKVCSRIKPEFSDKIEIFKSVVEANVAIYICVWAFFFVSFFLLNGHCQAMTAARF